MRLGGQIADLICMARASALIAIVLVCAAPAAGATTDPPELRGHVSVRGTPRVGRVVRCDPGAWLRAGLFRYRWLRNGAPIKRAHLIRYRLERDDLHTRLTCRVTAANAGGSTTALSASVWIKQCTVRRKHA